MPDPVVYSVSDITRRIRGVLEPAFPNLCVEGEVTDLRVQASGHAYFSLKDDGAQLPVAMFAQAFGTVSFRLANGVKVRAYGSVTVYPPHGRYQLTARRLERVGKGDLMEQLEALKRRLRAEGLFDPARRRPLPLLPRVVGIATSPTGAAIRDMLNVTRRRCPNLRLLLAPCRVQGAGAAAEVAAAVRLLNSLRPPDRPDVLIVGRGGGSMEDLWCFNDEALARAVAASSIPVISAVGHETDTTVIDFVADVRAPTPSAAAELVAGRTEDFLSALDAAGTRLRREMRHALDAAEARVARARDHRVFSQPQSLVQQHRQTLDLIDASMRASLSEAAAAARRRVEAAPPRLRFAAGRALETARMRLSPVPVRLGAAFGAALADRKRRLELLAGRLDAMNPLAVLRRGYGIVRGPDGRVLRSTAALSPGDLVTARVADGEFAARVVAPGDGRDGGGREGHESPATSGGERPAGRVPARPKRKRPGPPEDSRQMSFL